MKKIITIPAAVILAMLLAACEPAYPVDIDNGTGRGQIGAIEDYRTTTGWIEGNIITTPDGHYWKVENTDNYTGYVDVFFDGKGTEILEDDQIVLIIEKG